MKKVFFSIIFCLALFGYTNITSATDDPFPPCSNPPENVMPSSCIDKIENGLRTERYNFNCISGYTKSEKECVKNCDSPYIMYQGRCNDPFPPCETPIENSTSCIDKIENGQYIEHHNFSCLPGYTKSGDKCAIECQSPYVLYQGACTDPVPSCKNPIANSTSCVDKIENGQYTEHYNFNCLPGYMKSGNQCVTECQPPYVLHQGTCNDPIPPCKTPIANSISCIDKIENGQYIEHYSFSCLPGYNKTIDSCTTKEETKDSCDPPYVLYQGQCNDPFPFCETPIANSTSCIDKIENGQYIEHHNFSCLPGYSKTSNTCTKGASGSKCEFPYVEYQGKCTDPIPSCKNWPANAVSCIDKIENGKRIYHYNLQCKVGYVRSNNTCVIKNAYKKVKATNAQSLPPAGYEDAVIVNTKAYENPFPDTNTEYNEGKAASELYRRGVIGGYPDGEFKGAREVNRAEAAKFLLLAKIGSVEELKNTGKFPDVMEGQWYVKFVVKAANMGIIQGHPDGRFRPQNTVNTAEFLKMLTKTFNLEENLTYSYSDISPSDWFVHYAGTAQKYSLFPNRSTKLEPSKIMTRDEVAVAIYQFLKNR